MDSTTPESRWEQLQQRAPEQARRAAEQLAGMERTWPGYLAELSGLSWDQQQWRWDRDGSSHLGPMRVVRSVSGGYEVTVSCGTVIGYPHVEATAPIPA